RGAWEGADYALHAPVFTPVSKHASGAALGHDGLARFVERCGLPVWAVGGITSERIGELASTGARGAAAIGAVWGIDATPIRGAEGPITDAVGIETRAAALVEAAGHVFSEVPQ
ncbi:MAG: thiamine phosphate synthase, partial [Myxococcota bacterium]